MQFLSEKTHTPEQLFDEIAKLNHLESISIDGNGYSLVINPHQSTYEIDIFQSLTVDRLTTRSLHHQAKGIEKATLKALFEEVQLHDAAYVINHLSAILNSSSELIKNKELADAEDKEMELFTEASEWEISAQTKALETSFPDEYQRIKNSYLDQMNRIDKLIVELKEQQNEKNLETLLHSQSIVSLQTTPIQLTPNLLAHSTYQYTSKLDGNGISIDSKNQNIQLILSYSRFDITYSQLVSCELCIDSETVIKTSRLGQVGGALLGGFLAGGVGALAGAGGAQKREVGNIHNIEVRILTANNDRPIHVINFFKHGNGWLSISPTNSDIENAQELQDLLAIAIHESKNNPTQANTSSPVTIPQHSLADELSKLADLKNQGFITDVEFATAKLKLLS